MVLNVLLTGGSGFIGKNIVKSFSKTYNIIAPRSNELNLLDQHAVDRFFEQYQIDIVIHSAVKPGHRNAEDTKDLFYSNTRMFFNLVRHQHKYKKMVFLSSGAVYDVTRNLDKIKETDFDEYVPSDEHGFSKYVCGKYIEQAENIIELRLFGVFGKYEDYSIRFISNAICKSLFDLPITLRQNRVFDYLYIDDLMPILDHFINNTPKYSVYNITPTKSIELYQIAEKVVEVSNKSIPIIVGSDSRGLSYTGNSIRLVEEMGDGIFSPIDSSIAKLYKWYHKNKYSIDKQCLLIDK